MLYAGLRRGEILGLRWKHVFLADPEGARLEVRETVVYGKQETPKSERAVRTIALGPGLADELFQHRSRTMFDGDDERVFCHPERGRRARSQALREDAQGVVSIRTCPG